MLITYPEDKYFEHISSETSKAIDISKQIISVISDTDSEYLYRVWYVILLMSIQDV